MDEIEVPRTPKKAFNKNRKASALLLAQATHLEWAALPAAKRGKGKFRRKHVKTEHQAAERIAELSKIVKAMYTEPEKQAEDSGAPVQADKKVARTRKTSTTRTSKKRASARKAKTPRRRRRKGK